MVQALGLATLSPMLNACARMFQLPVAGMATPESGPGTDRDPSGIWREGAAYARWTPSPHNIQPWRLRVISSTECELLIDPARTLPQTDPTSAFTILGLAMFVEYLSVAVRPRGVEVHAAYVGTAIDYTATTPTLFARLTLAPARGDARWNRALLLTRKTSRLPYDGTIVDDRDLETVAQISRELGHTMTSSSDHEMVEWTKDLNRFTLFRDLDDDAGRTELRKWIRTTDDEAASKKDGLWSHCLRFPGWLLKAFFDEHTEWGRGWRAKVCGEMLVQGMRGTRTVAWWRGPFAGPADWIQTGTMLGRVWLELAQRGIQLHPFGSVITNVEAHAKLVSKVGAPPANESLWFLARLGRSDVPPRSYRLDEHAIFIDDVSHG